MICLRGGNIRPNSTRNTSRSPHNQKIAFLTNEHDVRILLWFVSWRDMRKVYGLTMGCELDSCGFWLYLAFKIPLPGENLVSRVRFMFGVSAGSPNVVQKSLVTLLALLGKGREKSLKVVWLYKAKDRNMNYGHSS